MGTFLSQNKIIGKMVSFNADGRQIAKSELGNRWLKILPNGGIYFLFRHIC
jgi:hypothetical protein